MLVAPGKRLPDKSSSLTHRGGHLSDIGERTAALVVGVALEFAQ